MINFEYYIYKSSWNVSSLFYSISALRVRGAQPSQAPKAAAVASSASSAPQLASPAAAAAAVRQSREEEEEEGKPFLPSPFPPSFPSLVMVE